MNRNLWGVENFEEIKIRHSKFAAQRFAHEAAPALTSFAKKCCNDQATAQKLHGAAQTSFTKKCLSDATGT